MRTIFRHSALLASLAAVTSGCAGMNIGTLADVLASGTGIYGSSLNGEIRSIDTRRQEIRLATGLNGDERIRYDNRTEVLYQQRRYEVRDLSIGDYVQVQLDEYRNQRYATTIRVQESGRRGGSSTQDPRANGNRRIEQLEGRIDRIDQRQGWLEMDDRYGTRVLVTLPYQANRGLSDRFNRLRRGDRVRIEGERLNAGRMELHRIF